ncbi:MAG: MBOAT family protein, partial [Muribaculaceae bacterium]|nr:MBOAT family protein [Muribaculaceae bacterium]
RLFSPSLFNYHGLTMRMATMLMWCAALIVVEWLQRERQHVLQIDGCRLLSTRPARLALYALLVFIIFYFAGQVQTFIYFQF